MHDYRKINWYKVCQMWAEYHGDHFPRHLASQLTSNQFGIFTRKCPGGRRLTEPEARRFFQRCLRRHRLYPRDRPATPSDLKVIRAAIREETWNEELV